MADFRIQGPSSTTIGLSCFFFWIFIAGGGGIVSGRAIDDECAVCNFVFCFCGVMCCAVINFVFVNLPEGGLAVYGLNALVL